MTDAAQPVDWQQLIAKLVASPSSLSPEEITILKQTPATTPPFGVVPNFVNPPSIKTIQYGVTSALLVLMIMVFVNRVYVKTVLMKKYELDDLTLLLSFIGTIVYYATAIWGAERGKMGTHLWDINVLDSISIDFMGPSYVLTILPSIILGFLKTTFFILYLKLFKQDYWIRISTYVGLASNTAVYIAFTVALIYYGTPRPGEKFYTHDLTNSGRLAVPVAVVGFVIDVVILVIPIVAISGLQTSRRKKLGAMLIFLSGLLACICSVLSIYYRLRLDSSRRGSDITYKLIGVNTVSLAEMMIGVMCACMPSLAYSYRHIPAIQSAKRSLTSYFSTSKQTSSGSKFGSRTNRLPAIRKTNEVYVTMDDYDTYVSKSSSRTGMASVSHLSGPNTYDEALSPQFFKASSHLEIGVPRSEQLYGEVRTPGRYGII